MKFILKNLKCCKFEYKYKIRTDVSKFEIWILTENSTIYRKCLILKHFNINQIFIKNPIIIEKIIF